MEEERGQDVTNVAYAAFALCDGILGTVERENTRSEKESELVRENVHEVFEMRNTYCRFEVAPETELASGSHSLHFTLRCFFFCFLLLGAGPNRTRGLARSHPNRASSSTSAPETMLTVSASASVSESRYGPKRRTDVFLSFASEEVV
jgi:hypothetical protein